MKFPCRSDSHTHSHHSPDGADTVSAMYKRAVDLGLAYYTVTDHYECHDHDGSVHGHDYRKGADGSCQAIEQAARELPGDTVLLTGVELGQPLQNLPAARHVLSKHDYDFVLASVHNIRNFEDFYFLDYQQMSISYISDLLAAYFQEILEMIQWGRFDALAHLTYPLRYIRGDAAIDISMEAQQPVLREIFALLVEKQIALELNTSGLRQKIGCTLPDLPLLKQYYEMGGRLITIGSDAHRVDDLGKGIDEGLSLLQEVGFSAYTVYRNHVPLLLPLC